MKPRIDYSEKFPDALRGLLRMEKYVHQSELNRSLYELVKIRASQINQCAYCIDMHTKDARHAGETEQRIYALSAWRETSFFTEKERAALEWTEALTLISESGVPDALYKRVREHFDESELIALTLSVIAINGWNRLAISMNTPAGTYQPGDHG